MKEYLYKIFKLVFKNRYDKDVLKLNVNKLDVN